MFETIKNENIQIPGYKVFRLKIDYTRQQIAEMTGLRVETVKRVMRNLIDKKYFDYRERKSFLLDDLHHKIIQSFCFTSQPC